MLKSWIREFIDWLDTLYFYIINYQLIVIDINIYLLIIHHQLKFFQSYYNYQSRMET